MDNSRGAQGGSEYGSDIEYQIATAISDYGSDIALDDFDEDNLLADVLDSIKDTRPAERDAILPSLEFEGGELEDEEHVEDGFVQIHRLSGLRVAKSDDTSTAQSAAPQRDAQSSPPRRHEALEIEYDQRSRRAWSGALILRKPSQH